MIGWGDRQQRFQAHRVRSSWVYAAAEFAVYVAALAVIAYLLLVWLPQP